MAETTAVRAGRVPEAEPAPVVPTVPSTAWTTVPSTAWTMVEAVGTFLFGTAVLAAALGAFAASMTVLAVPLVVFGLLGWVLAGCAWRERRARRGVGAAGGGER